VDHTTHNTIFATLNYITLYPSLVTFLIFFFNDTATPEIYTLSLHDALPISQEVATEDAERAGDVVDEIEGIEPGATQMYGERVLEGLEARHEAAAGVAHAQVPRDRDHIGIGEVPHGVPHHVVVEGGVAVEGHDNLAGSEREALV